MEGDFAALVMANGVEGSNSKNTQMLLSSSHYMPSACIIVSDMSILNFLVS